MIDNTFILDLKEDRLRYLIRSKRRYRIMARILPPFFRFVNRHNNLVKLSFSYDALNDELDIRRSYRHKENMLKGYMTSLEQAINIYHLLEQTLVFEILGDVVELGCYEGTTAMLLRKTLDGSGSDKLLHVYDSFEGLPEESEFDGDIAKGGMLATTREAFVENFQSRGLQLPEIHAGWFKDTLPTELPEQISFAHLDGDFYSSILESLEYVYPRLSKGAVVVVDDYCDPDVLEVNNFLPGVKQACDEFFADKPEEVKVLVAGCEAHGYFRKAG